MFILNSCQESEIQKLNSYLAAKKLLSIEVGCGIPIYNPNNAFEKTLESILFQDQKCLIFIADDSENDLLEHNLILKFQQFDNLIYLRNDKRLGQLLNTKLVRNFFKTNIPSVKYYFLASDHDIWSREFTKLLVTAFKKFPKAVLAYPNSEVINISKKDFEEIQITDMVEKIFYTNCLSDDTNLPIEPQTIGLISKLNFVKNKLSAGNMIYGLENISISSPINYYEATLGPDRLFLMKLISQGDFIHINRTLWLRVQFSKHSRERQISNLFPFETPPKKIFLKLPDWHHILLIFQDKKLKFGFKFLIAHYLFYKPLMQKCKKILKTINRVMKRLRYYIKLSRRKVMISRFLAYLRSMIWSLRRSIKVNSQKEDK